MILKIVKFHINDYFWFFIFITLKFLINHMNHMWSIKFHYHIQACFCYKVSFHHFWLCNTTFLSDKRKVEKHIKILLHQHHIWFFLKNIVCLSLQLLLLFLFLKNFIIFEVIFICHTLFLSFSVKAILVVCYCSIFLLLLHYYHLSYHSHCCLLFVHSLLVSSTNCCD